VLGFLDVVLDGLIARIASGQSDDNLPAVLDLVEESVRRSG
jgi:TetR/AcrR family transcriptional regulator, transcriptional repressor of aconitase